MDCLLGSGIDSMTYNNKGRAALHFAVIRGNREVLQALF